MKELGCRDQMSLLRKMDSSKIRLYLDEQSRWRVAVQKTKANEAELNHIDSAILRKYAYLIIVFHSKQFLIF